MRTTDDARPTGRRLRVSRCPRCGGPEEPDWHSAVECVTRLRIRCLMGHSRWVELTPAVIATPIGKYQVVNRTYPPIPCERCGFAIEPRLALNQKRHGRCADLENADRRKASRDLTARQRATRIIERVKETEDGLSDMRLSRPRDESAGDVRALRRG